MTNFEKWHHSNPSTYSPHCAIDLVKESRREGWIAALQWYKSTLNPRFDFQKIRKIEKEIKELEK